jgi:hypothetical protein
MSKSVLYGWQRFIDDQPVHRYSPQQNSNQRGLNKLVSMLNEMQQKVIDVLTPLYEGWLGVIPKKSSQPLIAGLQFSDANNRSIPTGSGFQLA